MTLGSVEAGALVGFSGLISMIISKIKCYHKRPSCLCAYMDANDVVENDDVHVNVATINGIELLYVSNKKEQSDDDDSSDDDKCVCSSPFKF